MIIIKFNVYGNHFEKSVPKSLLETKTINQIHQQEYKKERYKVLRDKGIGKEKYIPKRKNNHYNTDIERHESACRRSKEYQRRKRLERKTVEIERLRREFGLGVSLELFQKRSKLYP